MKLKIIILLACLSFNYSAHSSPSNLDPDLREATSQQNSLDGKKVTNGLKQMNVDVVKLFQVNIPAKTDSILNNFKNLIRLSFGRLVGVQLEFYDQQKTDVGTSISIKLNIDSQLFKQNLKTEVQFNGKLKELNFHKERIENELKTIEKRIEILNKIVTNDLSDKEEDEVKKDLKSLLMLQATALKSLQSYSSQISSLNAQNEVLTKEFNLRFDPAYFDKYAATNQLLSDSLVAAIDQISIAMNASVNSVQYIEKDVWMTATTSGIVATREYIENQGIHEDPGTMLNKAIKLIEKKTGLKNIEILNQKCIEEPKSYYYNSLKTDWVYSDFEYRYKGKFPILSNVKLTIDFSKDLVSDLNEQPLTQKLTSRTIVAPLYFLELKKIDTQTQSESSNVTEDINVSGKTKNSTKSTASSSYSFLANDPSAKMKCERYMLSLKFMEAINKDLTYFENKFTDGKTITKVNTPNCIKIKISVNEKESAESESVSFSGTTYFAKNNENETVQITVGQGHRSHSYFNSYFKSDEYYWVPSVEVEFYRNAFK